MTAGSLFLPLFRRNFGGGVDHLGKFWGGWRPTWKILGGGDERPKKWGEEMDDRKNGGGGERCAANGRAKPHIPPSGCFWHLPLNESLLITIHFFIII